MTRKIMIIALLLIGMHAKAQEISGTISNLEDKKLIFSWTDDFLINKKDTIITDSNGNFSVTISFKRAGYLTLRNSAFLSDDIYIWPNAKLNIVADGKSGVTYYNSRKYSGSAENINNFFASMENSTALKAHYFGSVTYKLPEEKFTSAINRYFEVRDSIKNAYFRNSLSESDVLKKFLITDSINMVYFKSSAWFSYLKNDIFFSTYIEPLAKENENEEYLSSSNYRYFWSNIIKYKLQKIREVLPSEMSRSSQPYYQNIPNLIDTHLTGKIKQIVASSYLSNIVYFYKEIDENIIKIADNAIEKLYIQLNDK